MIDVRYYPCQFEDRYIEFKTHDITPISILQNLLRKYPEIRKDDGGLVVRVNGRLLIFSEWMKPLNPSDRVWFIQEVGYGIGELIAGIIAVVSGVGGGFASGTALAGILGMSLATTINLGLAVLTLAYSIYTAVASNAADKPGGIGGGLSNSPTYGWDGMQMQVRPGVPVAIVYGEHTTGGNLIECFITTEGNNNYLNMLIGLCEGEIAGIMKEDLSDVCTLTSDDPYILLNDNLISNLQGVTWDFRLGTQEQTLIGGYGNIHQTFQAGQVKMTAGAPYVWTTTEDDVEGFELRFRSPGCYFQYKGNYFPNWMNINIYHKLHTAPSYPGTPTGQVFINSAFSTTYRTYYRKDNLTPGQYDIKMEFTCGYATSIPYVQSDIYLDHVVEIKYDTLTYPHTALLALKILATDQLNGQIPNVITRLRGRKSLNLDTETIEWTKNPLYNTNDLIVTPRFGLGNYITQANMNHDQIIAMADYCDHIVGDGSRHTIDAITGTTLTDNEYTFVAGDVGKNICCKDPGDTTTYVHLTITSITTHVATGSAGWKKYDGSAGTTPTLPGSWEWGEKRNEMDLVIDTPLEAIDGLNQVCASFRGVPIWNKNAIQIAIDKKDTPSYLFNMGNIISGSFRHVYASEKSMPNVFQVDYADHVNDFKKETVDVVDHLTIASGTPRRVRRLSLFGATRRSQVYREGRFHLFATKYQDESIQFKGGIDAIHMFPMDIVKFQHDVFQWGFGGRIVSATSNTITLDQTVTIVLGYSYVIVVKYSDDTMQTVTVIDGAGSYTTLHVSPNFTSIPPAWGLYAFGIQSVETKPFRIMQVSRTPENEIEIMATEYSESVYSDTDIVIADPFYADWSNLPPHDQWPVPIIPGVYTPPETDPMAVPPDVTGLTLQETIDTTGVKISFTQPGATTIWDHAEIWISRDSGATYLPIATVNTGDPYIYRDVIAGNTYYFKVYSYSTAGKQSTSPPVEHITMSGVSVDAPSALTVTSGFQHMFLDWTNPEPSPFNDYWIQIWRSDDNNRANAAQIAEVQTDYYSDFIAAPGTTRYYWIRTKAKNGGISAWYPAGEYAGVSGTTGTIAAADINNFAITASKMFTKIPIVDGDSWTDDSPSSGYVAWNAHTLYYNGVAYSIVSGNTDLKYIYWVNAASSYSASDSHPVLNDGDFIIATNIGGAHDLAWNAIANQVVGSAYIQDAAVINAKIGSLAVDEAKLGNAAVTNAKIADLAVSTGKIENLAVTTAKIANLAVDEGKIGNAAITNAKIGNLAVGTMSTNYFAMTRGAQYHNANGVTLNNNAEVEIGNVTVTTFENNDSVWIWAQATQSQAGLDFKAQPVPVDFRIRRGNISGTIITGGTIQRITGTPLEVQPMVIVGTDLPGGGAGNKTYLLTVRSATSPANGLGTPPIINQRFLMVLAKSR